MARVRAPSRAAFVLLELLIVLAVLASVAAVSWPAVSTLLAKSEIQSAAKQVRAALARARLDAMESESVRQFRYRPGTGRFEIAALTSPAGTDREDASSAAGSLATDSRVEGVLPSSVRFEPPGGADLPGSDAAPLVPEDESWSTPLLFFPNGRTSNATIRLRGRRDHVVQLSLRGVTGTVSIGKPEVPEDEP